MIQNLTHLSPKIKNTFKKQEKNLTTEQTHVTIARIRCLWGVDELHNEQCA